MTPANTSIVTLAPGGVLERDVETRGIQLAMGPVAATNQLHLPCAHEAVAVSEELIIMLSTSVTQSTADVQVVGTLTTGTDNKHSNTKPRK